MLPPALGTECLCLLMLALTDTTMARDMCVRGGGGPALAGATAMVVNPFRLKPRLSLLAPKMSLRHGDADALALEAGPQPKPAVPAQLALPPPPPQRRLLPLAVLLLVPVVWGTYGVAVKSLFALEIPPPELLYTFVNYVVSYIAISAASLLTSLLRPKCAAAAPGETTPLFDSAGRRALTLAGMELGAYVFLGSSCQIFGMRSTSAIRGAFIVQLSTVITPLIDAVLLRNTPSAAEVGGCLLAFAGVALLIGDGDVAGVGAGVGAAASSLGGDALIGLAAVFYSCYVARLSQLAPSLEPLKLARAKEVWRLGYSLVVLVGAVLCTPGQAAALDAFMQSAIASSAVAGTAALIVLWTGVVTTAFPTWYLLRAHATQAQSFGQRFVDASTATVVYTTQPLWSALFGWLLLGERLGEQAWLGAAVIFVAVAVVAREQMAQAARQGRGGGGEEAETSELPRRD